MACRENAQWMKQADDRILEHLETEGWATSELIAEKPSMDISEGHVRERLLFLWYAGFVDQIWEGAYEITATGQEYLRGELDARHQPTPTVDRVLRG